MFAQNTTTDMDGLASPPGRLPGWVTALVDRMLAAGLVPEAPDQLTVNEYHPGVMRGTGGGRWGDPWRPGFM